MACRKQILDFIGYSNYEAHSSGKIYNIKLQRYMSTYINNAGYICVSITNDQGKKCNELVHVLVAKAFLKNPKGLSDVGHCDANKSNNALSNLEWTTHSDNVKKMHQDKAKFSVNLLDHLS